MDFFFPFPQNVIWELAEENAVQAPENIMQRELEHQQNVYIPIRGFIPSISHMVDSRFGGLKCVHSMFACG